MMGVVLVVIIIAAVSVWLVGSIPVALLAGWWLRRADAAAARRLVPGVLDLTDRRSAA